MKGYVVGAGYMGWVGDRYMIFATEGDYVEYYKEVETAE